MNNKNKKSVFNKFIKIGVYSISIILILLFITPFLFKGKIENYIKKTVNKSLNATISFDETSLSFFRDFPLANISVNNLAIVNKAPFEGDTLFSARQVSLSMSIKELLKGENEAKQLKNISTKNGFVNIYFDENGNENFNIVKSSDTTTENTSQSNIKLDINSYKLENIRFHYFDKASKIDFVLDNINHQGKGNFAKSTLDLDTKTDAFISLSLENINYLNNVHIDLDAIIGIDLETLKFTFKDNIAHINKLPLKFDGFLQLLDTEQQYLIDFSTPTSTFKNALALLPEQYSNNLENIKTDGNFILKGNINGLYSENSIPNFLIILQADNAYFKYNDLPKDVKNINIDIALANTTSKLEDIYLTIKKSTFSIDGEVFNLNGKITSLMTNPKVELNADGSINLSKLSQVYPSTIDNELNGIVKANVSTNFSMDAINNSEYNRIKTAGAISILDFTYDEGELPKKVTIESAFLNFNTNTVSLNNFKGKTGNSDLELNGNLSNFYGFLFKDEVLKGNFNLFSKKLKVEDFITTNKVENQEVNSNNEQPTNIKIPDFIDVTLNAQADTVTYNNITLNDVKGKLNISNQTVTLQNISSSIFGGNIAFNGKVSTQKNIPEFNMNLNLQKVGISESFSKLDMLNAIAPIASAINGKINTKINVSGDLTDELVPNLTSLTGNLFGQLVEAEVSEKKSKILNLLDNKLNFIDVSSLNLNDITGNLSFNNGKVNVKPIKISYKDVNMNVSGEHSFDNKMDYDVNFDVPTKYLGSKITKALEKLTVEDAKDLEYIPVNGKLNGSFSDPSLKTDLADASSNLFNSIVEKQKQNILNKGKSKLNNLIDDTGIIKDSSKTETKEKIKNTLKNLFSKKNSN